MAEPKKQVDASVVVPFPVLRAMAYTVHTRRMELHVAAVFDSFAIHWLKTEIAAGGHTCPTCGNLWSTREKRLACNHAGGSPSPDTARQIGHWIEAAEKEL
jgi:hypothetical protein